MPRPKVSQNAPGGRGIDLRWTFIYPRSEAGGRRGVIALKTFWLKSKRKDTQVRAMGCGVFWQSGARNSNASRGGWTSRCRSTREYQKLLLRNIYRERPMASNRVLKLAHRKQRLHRAE